MDGGANQLIEGLARLEVEEGVVRVTDEEGYPRRVDTLIRTTKAL